MTGKAFGDMIKASKLRGVLGGLAPGKGISQGFTQGDVEAIFYEPKKGKYDRSYVPVKSIYYRYKPFNLFVRGSSLYFVPPRLISTKTRTVGEVLSFAFAFYDANTIYRKRRIQPAIMALFNLQGRIRYGLIECSSDSSVQNGNSMSWVKEIIKYGGYQRVRTKLRIEDKWETINKLIGINIYKINLKVNTRKGKPRAGVNLAYAVATKQAGDISLTLLYLLRIGPDANLRAVISDPPYIGGGSTRFIAIGYNSETLAKALGSYDLNDVSLDLKCMKELINRKISKKLKSIAKSYFEYLRDAPSLGELLSTGYTVHLGGSKPIEVKPMKYLSINNMKQIDHFYRYYDINVYSHVLYFNKGKRENTLLKLMNDSESKLLVETMEGVTYVRRLRGISFSSKALIKKAYEPYIHHSYTDIVVENSRSIAVRLLDPSLALSRSVASAAQHAYNDTYKYLAVRKLLYNFLYYSGSTKQSGSARAPAPCTREGAKYRYSWDGYFDLDRLSNEIFNIIKNDDNKKYREFLEQAERIVKQLGPNAIDVWQHLLPRLITWTLAYLFIKGAANILGPSFINNISVACSEEEGYNVYIIEDITMGAGFVDLIEEDYETLAEVIDALSLIAREHSRPRGISSSMSNYPGLSTLLSCIGEIQQSLRAIGLDNVPLEVFRYIVSYALYECNSACPVMPSCQKLAESIKKNKKLEENIRGLLTEAYSMAIDECWDGCLSCVHISQRDLPEGLTQHEQIVYVSRRIGEVLASLAASVFVKR